MDRFRYADWEKLLWTPKTRVALGFLAVGFVGSIVGFTSTYNSVEESHPWLDTWRGLFVSLFTVGFLTFAPEFIEVITESVVRNKFRKFFGQDVFKTGVEIVYQHSRTSKVVVKRYLHHSEKMDEWREYHGIELDVIVIPDMDAVNAISQLCSRMKVDVEIGFEDNYVTGNLPSRTLIAVGLLCNIAVNDACGLSHGLLSIDESTPDPTVFHVVKPDGERKSYGGKGGGEYAVILRTLHRDNDGKKMIPFFVCGGSTEWGTKAAGLYLRRNWLDLLDEYSKENMDIDRDTLAAVIRFGASSPRSVDLISSFFAPGKSGSGTPRMASATHENETPASG